MITSLESISAASIVTARFAMILTSVVILLLVSLHFLSPEFDPAWRMVSEYAMGSFGWILSLMFLAWALSSWTLAYALWFQVATTAGRIGLVFLIAAGVGEAMAAVFDIKHSLHGPASMIGIPSLPIAAMLITLSLIKAQPWSTVKSPLLWTANLTWISMLLMAAAFIIMMITFQRTGLVATPGQVWTEVPQGVIALVGWANRFLILAYCAWVMVVGWNIIRLSRLTP